MGDFANLVHWLGVVGVNRHCNKFLQVFPVHNNNIIDVNDLVAIIISNIVPMSNNLMELVHLQHGCMVLVTVS